MAQADEEKLRTRNLIVDRWQQRCALQHLVGVLPAAARPSMRPGMRTAKKLDEISDQIQDLHVSTHTTKRPRFEGGIQAAEKPSTCRLCVSWANGGSGAHSARKLMK